jgi:hypothetical protein
MHGRRPLIEALAAGNMDHSRSTLGLRAWLRGCRLGAYFHLKLMKRGGLP